MRDLNNFDKDELLEEIRMLKRKFPDVRNYYAMRSAPHKSAEIVEKCKARMAREYRVAGDELGRLDLRNVRKTVQEFSKINANITHQIDLELYYVELGVKFTNNFGDMTSTFYRSLESMFERALKNIQTFNQKTRYIERVQSIIKNTQGIGWGFGDHMELLGKEYKT